MGVKESLPQICVLQQALEALSFLINQFRNAVTAFDRDKAQFYFLLQIRKEPCTIPQNRWNDRDMVGVNEIVLHDLPDNLRPAAYPNILTVLTL